MPGRPATYDVTALDDGSVPSIPIETVRLAELCQLVLDEGRPLHFDHGR